MKKNSILLICQFVIIGIYSLQMTSCQKIVDDTLQMNITMVDIPGGTFIMGSPTTEPERSHWENQHQVTLSAFKMSKYEITNAQFAAFLNARSIGSDGKYAGGAYPTKILIYASPLLDSAGKYRFDWGLHYTGGLWVPVQGCENHPVIFVTWFGATEFATSVGMRLPTEAEWEYACRAGTITTFYSGDCLPDAQENYNWRVPFGDHFPPYCKNINTIPPDKTQPVGTYLPNPWGLYDMHGNVEEFCSDKVDLYEHYPSTPQTNPTGPAQGDFRAMRGGAFDECAYQCRSAFRKRTYVESKYEEVAGVGYWFCGFRIASSH
jgi:sulfatase modifying factor 1